MATCTIALGDKRTVARKVGKQLTTLYGRRQHYSPQLVKAAMRRCDFPDLWDCWALSLFSSPSDFAAYHATLGEVCDYSTMHADMLSSIDTGSLLDFLSLDWSGGESFGDSSSFDLPDHHL